MDYTWIVSTPTGPSGKPPMSVGAVRHRFLLLLFLLLLFVLVAVEFIFESCSRDKVKSSRDFKLFLSLRLSLCLWTSKQNDGGMIVSSLTLHSGQSYPGTPAQPGSRTGTHPGGQSGGKRAFTGH